MEGDQRHAKAGCGATIKVVQAMVELASINAVCVKLLTDCLQHWYLR